MDEKGETALKIVQDGKSIMKATKKLRVEELVTNKEGRRM
jgi:hypothetical protein